MTPAIREHEKEERIRLEALLAAKAARARALLHLDLAAALASDHIRATFVDPAASGITDWIVDLGHNGHEVLFFLATERVGLCVTFAADGHPLGERVDIAATPRQLMMLNAKRTAVAANIVPHDVAYNAIPIPPHHLTHGALIEVYLIRRAVTSSELVLGGHWHTLVSSNGTQVLDSTSLMSAGSCPGEVPSEILLYLSLKHDRPIEVVTPAAKARWYVRGDEVTFLGLL
jgi:hypothetical protein